MKHNTALINAFNYLKANRIIKDQKELAEKLVRPHSTVNRFLLGQSKADAAFVEAFCRQYEIDLKDFREFTIRRPIKVTEIELIDFMSMMETKMVALEAALDIIASHFGIELKQPAKGKVVTKGKRDVRKK